MLNQRGLRAKLIQNLSGFHFSQLAEVRYFLKQLVPDTDSTIPRHIWDQAKQRTLQTYATSSLCELMQTFFADYESTHTALYLSDLNEYLLESNIEDFFHAPSGTITVSTIHKAKGREYDNVFLLAAGLGTSTPQDLRALYVAITRAKNALYVHTDNPVFATVAKVQRVPPAPTAQQPLCIPLGHRDVYLDFFKDKKKPREILPQAEKLKSIGLDLPQATELIWLLRNRGMTSPRTSSPGRNVRKAVYRLLNGGA
jgi:ATP-dependent DNA helicase RecQ